MAQRSPREAVQRFDSGEVAVLDVRGQGEYDTGHVPGARHIPLGGLAVETGASAVNPEP